MNGYWKMKKCISYLFICLGLLFVSLALLPVLIGAGLLLIVLIGLLRFPYLLPKLLLYEVAIADLMVRDLLTRFFPKLRQSWWHPITEQLILGGIPLLNKNHEKKIRELNVQAVCAVIEPFEMQLTTLFSVPVSPQKWNEQGVVFQRFSCSDMEAMDLLQLEEAVAWIHSHILEKKKVYLHCKAGRGRSATLAVCYLMRFQKMSFKEAMQHVRSCRPLITFRPSQLARIQEFNSACFPTCPVS